MNCLLCFRTPLTHSTMCLRERSVNRPPMFLLIWETRVQVGEHLWHEVLCIPLFYTHSTPTPFNLHPLLSFSPASFSYSLQKVVWNIKTYDKNLCWREMMSEFQHSERPSWSLLRPLQSSHNRISRLSRSVRRTGRSGNSRLSSTTFSNSRWAEREYRGWLVVKDIHLWRCMIP